MKISNVCFVAAATAALASPAIAGTNAGGYLLLHTDDSVIYTQDNESTYCSLFDAVCPFDPECDDDHAACGAALLGDVNVTSGLGAAPAMIWVVAAFDPDSCPRVKACQFGLSWDLSAEPTFSAFGNCGDFEIATDGWPGTLNSGTAVTFSQPITRTGFPVYWFAAYNYYGPLDISIADFPSGSDGATFADDSIPAVLDRITSDHWGVVGLNGETGFNPYNPANPTLESSWGQVKAIFGR